MRLHFKLANAFRFGWKGLQGFSYSEKSNFERASAARFKVSERHGRVFNDSSDRIYLVLAGAGWFDLAGDKFDVAVDDVIIVPRGTIYDYGGSDLEMFLVHSPAFDAKADHDLDGLQTR